MFICTCVLVSFLFFFLFFFFFLVSFLNIMIITCFYIFCDEKLSENEKCITITNIYFVFLYYIIFESPERLLYMVHLDAVVRIIAYIVDKYIYPKIVDKKENIVNININVLLCMNHYFVYIICTGLFKYILLIRLSHILGLWMFTQILSNSLHIYEASNSICQKLVDKYKDQNFFGWQVWNAWKKSIQKFC